MSYTVIEINGAAEARIDSGLSARDAAALSGLMNALRTDGDPRRYIVRAQTGFLFMAVATVGDREGE